jgi:hypothetical protein
LGERGVVVFGEPRETVDDMVRAHIVTAEQYELERKQEIERERKETVAIIVAHRRRRIREAKQKVNELTTALMRTVPDCISVLKNRFNNDGDAIERHLRRLETEFKTVSDRLTTLVGELSTTSLQHLAFPAVSSHEGIKSSLRERKEELAIGRAYGLHNVIEISSQSVSIERERKIRPDISSQGDEVRNLCLDIMDRYKNEFKNRTVRFLQNNALIHLDDRTINVTQNSTEESLIEQVETILIKKGIRKLPVIKPESESKRLRFDITTALEFKHGTEELRKVYPTVMKVVNTYYNDFFSIRVLPPKQDGKTIDLTLDDNTITITKDTTLTSLNRSILAILRKNCTICCDDKVDHTCCTQCKKTFCNDCYFTLLRQGNGVMKCPYCRFETGYRVRNRQLLEVHIKILKDQIRRSRL